MDGCEMSKKCNDVVGLDVKPSLVSLWLHAWFGKGCFVYVL